MFISTTYKRWSLGILSIIGLLSVYLFQHADVASWLNVSDSTIKFLVNKSLRFLINDAMMIVLIYALFYHKKYVYFALWVQLAGVVFILLPYFLLKLVFHTGNGPLVSFLHRLVINPTLLLLLIPAFYYQHSKTR